MKRLGKYRNITIVFLLFCIAFACVLISEIPADTVESFGDNDLKYFHIYSVSGTAPYARLISKKYGTIWDDNNSELAASPTWTDTDVVFTTQMTTVGGWLLTIPTGLPSGTYDLLIYDVSTAAGSRSNADAVSPASKHMKIINGVIKQISSI